MNQLRFSRWATAGLALVWGVAAFAQDVTTKIAIINIQESITRTQEGQKLLKDLETRYAPKKQVLEGQQQKIATLRDQLSKGANTMSEEAQRKLMRDIQQAERDYQREVEDAQAAFNQDQQEVFNEIGGKLMTVIDKYAKEMGFSIVLDISSPQSPVLYAVNEVNITNEVITRYDSEGGAAAASAPAGGAAAKPAQP